MVQRSTLGDAMTPRLGSCVALAAILIMTAACSGGDSGSPASGDIWGTKTVAPAAFAQELESATGADKPVVVCVGPLVLYQLGHVPGAVFHGPASSADGLRDLTVWAQTLPRTTSLVIYCGCCPPADCPNLRPAYTALRDLGFKKLRVLMLDTNFNVDWAGRSLPVQK